MDWFGKCRARVTGWPFPKMEPLSWKLARIGDNESIYKSVAPASSWHVMCDVDTAPPRKLAW